MMLSLVDTIRDNNKMGAMTSKSHLQRGRDGDTVRGSAGQGAAEVVSQVPGEKIEEALKGS